MSRPSNHASVQLKLGPVAITFIIAAAIMGSLSETHAALSVDQALRQGHNVVLFKQETPKVRIWTRTQISRKIEQRVRDRSRRAGSKPEEKIFERYAPDPIVGRLIEQTAGVLVILELDREQTTSIPVGSIYRIDRANPSSLAAAGAIAGLATGIMLGADSVSDKCAGVGCFAKPAEKTGGAFAGAVIGSVIGLFVGGAVRVDNWEPVPIFRGSVPGLETSF